MPVEFLDFRKAFDTVNHEILLNKLIHYGRRGKTVNWFRSFLSQRVQWTSVSGFNLEPILVAHGVSQGPVLSFSLMIFTYQLNIVKYYILQMTQISYTQISL